KLLDRQLIYSYLKAYIVCLVSLLSLFIVVDLFTNLEKFSQHNPGLITFLKHVGRYYSMWTLTVFDRLGGSFFVLAAMFTVAWMQRHNELLPLLSAGVSPRRVVRPVLLAGCGMLGLVACNQEFLLPIADPFLIEHRLDPKDRGAVEARGTYT